MNRPLFAPRTVAPRTVAALTVKTQVRAGVTEQRCK